MISIPDLIDLVESCDPGSDTRFQESREKVLALLRQGPAAVSRRNFQPGHITGSAIVLTPGRTHVLLINHRHLKRWLQPGGHIEPEDRSVIETATREVAEETGIEVSKAAAAVLVGIDVHRIPGSDREPPHLHYDLVWRMFGSGPLNGTEEAIWCPISDLPAYGPDAALSSSIRRAIETP